MSDSSWAIDASRLYTDKEHQEDKIPKSFLMKGVLHHSPKKPVMPTRTVVVRDRIKLAYCKSGDTLEDVLRKLPAGTPLKDITIDLTREGDNTFLLFEKKVETENIFYDEEMKVYFVEELAYEASMKLWAIKVMCFRQAEIADASVGFEKALADTQKRGVRHPNKFEDFVTRSWLKTLDDEVEERELATAPVSQEMVDLADGLRTGRVTITGDLTVIKAKPAEPPESFTIEVEEE